MRATTRAPSSGWRRTIRQSSSLSGGSASRIASGKENLPMSCSRPAVCASSCWSRAAVRLGERAGVARDGGGVARGHAVAQGERLDHARQDAQLERRELLGPALRAQQLPDQVLEHDEDDPQQAERREPGLAVEDGDAHGEQRARQLGREHRDEDLRAWRSAGCPCGPRCRRRSSRSSGRSRARTPRTRRSRR